MPTKSLFAPALVLSVLAGLAGCTRPVVLDGSFSADAPRDGKFTNILVVGVSPDVNQRCRFEQSLAASLRSDAVKATMSCAVMDTKEQLSRESVERAIAAVGADAVLATTLVASSATAKEGATADARGGGYYKATDVGYDMYGYGNWGAYGVPVVYGEFETAPSVFSISGTAVLTTKVYETKGAALIYTLDTKAKNLASREMALAQITPAIAERLHREGLVR